MRRLISKSEDEIILSWGSWVIISRWLRSIHGIFLRVLYIDFIYDFLNLYSINVGKTSWTPAVFFPLSLITQWFFDFILTPKVVEFAKLQQINTA